MQLASRQLSFEPEALGRPRAWTVRQRGLEYEREVIVAEVVDRAWGEPPDGDLSFRVVFFTVPRRIGAGQIKDARIAMAVPRRPSVQIRSLGRELNAIRESTARYVKARDRDAEALRGSMTDRMAMVRSELARHYAISYSQGRIYAHGGGGVRPRAIFTGEIPASWADRLAEAVLLLAYPSLPFDHDGFPESLTESRIETLYRGLFRGDEDTEDTVRDYGPGLGLTRRDSPALFDAGQCRVADIIRAELESHGEEMAAERMIRVPTLGHGLTRPLATLYVMAFVRQAHAELELGSDRRGDRQRGRSLHGDHITWDLVPEVSLADLLAGELGTLRLRPSLAWDTAVPYAALLVEDLEKCEERAVVPDQERRLLDALEAMAGEIANALEALETLTASLGHGPSGALEALERLRPLCEVSNYREFYDEAQGKFLGPSGLKRVLDLYRRVGRLVELAPDIARTRLYLEQMRFGRRHQGLALGQRSVAGRIDPDGLLVDPSQWGGIEQSFRDMRRQYVGVYVDHHASYHQQTLAMGDRLEGLTAQIDALARCNEMPESGDAVGTEVPQLVERLRGSLKVCPAEADELSLEDVPYCPRCELFLDEEVPLRDATLLFETVRKAMQEYNRRLSSHVVRRVLARPTREQLDKLIDLAQVADLSALANVLDDEVVEFLRRFLKSG